MKNQKKNTKNIKNEKVVLQILINLHMMNEKDERKNKVKI